MKSAEVSKSNVIITKISLQDINEIVELQKESFPSMLEEGSVWREDHLKSHIKIFPEGQFCAKINGKIIGSSSSLIIKLNPNYADHTFSQITGKSYFCTHDPQGDSLYGADISVHPAFRRLGVATLLYNVRKYLSIKLNLKRIIAGGRLYNYCEYSEKISPEEYVQKVINMEISDPVLTFQLRNDFKFIKILANYIKDGRSLDYATFIEWINPYYKN
ncbi:MAG TPA: GNAT family N-acetyltransferase [Verrucomicrobiae bacterium]|nr:GNAT family N-acetyltransferase [Verrucomicrobiae bacterium]